MAARHSRLRLDPSADLGMTALADARQGSVAGALRRQVVVPLQRRNPLRRYRPKAPATTSSPREQFPHAEREDDASAAFAAVARGGAGRRSSGAAEACKTARRTPAGGSPSQS